MEEYIYDLDARYDSRKSFYGKARVQEWNAGRMIVKALWSYNTEICVIVCNIDENGNRKFGVNIRSGQPQSATTRRHLREFITQEMGVSEMQRIWYYVNDIRDGKTNDDLIRKWARSKRDETQWQIPCVIEQEVAPFEKYVERRFKG